MTRVKQTKPQAILILCREYKKDRGTVSGVRAVIRACKTLGFSYAELVQTLSVMQYCDHDGSRDYGWLECREIWEKERNRMPGDDHGRD